MALKGARPGRFHPRCPQCGEKFVLVVPVDHALPPLVSKPQPADAGETLAPSISMALGIAAPVSQTRAAATLPPPAATAAPTSAPTASPVETTARTATTTTPPPADFNTKRLGGYELLRKLGQGGMGSVFLARQLSLDRHVALKVLLGEFADDPQFVARFIREAYAAAQLTHHNVVQIHDIGAEQRTHFFSMEFVEGSTLASLIHKQGPLDAETAVSHVLQAARGLKFAHEHGLIHRDVKPENLLLNRHGIVKVADLGLVKTAQRDKAPAPAASGSPDDRNWYADDTTQLNVSMGTPAYMPPEQATDAHNVDVRADIYSLGCTLYALVVGHPPFSGKTALDVITKHQREPVTPPDRIVEHVPGYLSKVILKMLAKRPEDRYRNMDEVIAALEEFVGIESTGPYQPTEEQIRTLQGCVEQFNRSTSAKLKRKLARSFAPVCGAALLAALLLPVGGGLKFQITSGVIGFAVLTPLVYLALAGMRDRTYLFTRVREFFLDGGIVSLFCWIGGATLFLCLLLALSVHWAWLIALAAATAAASAFHWLIDASIDDERLDPRTRTEALLKSIRKTGVSEAAVQHFVCKHAGEHWEEFYEALFGYESKIMARREWGWIDPLDRKGKADRGRPRPTFAAWRDPIIEWIDARQRARREARDRQHFERIEEQNFLAKGFPTAAAKKKARSVAMSVVLSAAELHELAKARMLQITVAPPADAEAEEAGKEEPAAEKEAVKRPRKPVLDDEGLEGFERLSYFQRRFGGWAGFFLGSTVRFVLGTILIAGCLVWARQNDLLPTQQSFSVKLHTPGEPLAMPEPAARRDLSMGIVPAWISPGLSSWGAGVGGALLVLSAFVRAPNLGLFVVPAAAVAVAGSRMLPAIGPASSWVVASTAGAVIAYAGLRFTRD